MAKIYIEEKTRFTQPNFWDFIALIEAQHDAIPMRWILASNGLDLNALRVEYLAFEPKEYNFRATYRDPITQDNIPVTREIYIAIIVGVKTQVTG